MHSIPDRVCYLICGEPGTGTRLMARLISSAKGVYAGVKDTEWHSQKIVDELRMRSSNPGFARNDKIVFRMHPHGLNKLRRWTIGSIRDYLARFYNIFWIVPIRRLVRNIVKDENLDHNKTVDIFRSIPQEDGTLIVPVSMFFKDPEWYLKEIGRCLNLDLSGFTEEIKDPDQRWQKEWQAMIEKPVS